MSLFQNIKQDKADGKNYWNEDKCLKIILKLQEDKYEKRSDRLKDEKYILERLFILANNYIRSKEKCPLLHPELDMFIYDATIDMYNQMLLKYKPKSGRTFTFATVMIARANMNRLKFNGRKCRIPLNECFSLDSFPTRDDADELLRKEKRYTDVYELLYTRSDEPKIVCGIASKNMEEVADIYG